MYSGSSLHFKPVENFFHTPGYTDSCSLWRCKYTRESVVELLTNFTARTGEDLRPSYRALTANVFNFCSQAALICMKRFYSAWDTTSNGTDISRTKGLSHLSTSTLCLRKFSAHLVPPVFRLGWGCFPGLALCRWLPNAASTQGW